MDLAESSRVRGPNVMRSAAIQAKTVQRETQAT